MSTQLTKPKLGDLSIYDQFPDAKSAVNDLGHDIAASGIMGVSKPTQGKILALECFVRKMPPLMLAQRFDIIHDKLSMKSDAMRTDFEDKGATFRLLERTPDVVSAELERDGVVQRFTLTWAEATKEPFPYQVSKGVTEDTIIDLIEAGNPPKLKPKYRTPRSRMQMLWQRLVSDSVRAMDPSVVCGMYSPAEIEDFHENAGKTSRVVESEIIEGEWIDEPAAEVAAAKPVETAKPVEPAKGAAQSQSANGGTNGMCSADQSNRIKELWGLLNVSPENRDKQLASRNASGVRNLTHDQAVELIGKLESVLATNQTPEAVKTGLSEAEIAGQVRELLQQVNQVHPGTVASFKKKMAELKIASIDDLRREDKLSLLSALKAPHDIEKYFGIAIWEASPKN